MKKQPPKYAFRFLRWFCREDYLEEIEGDLTELFEKQYDQAPRKANWTFSWQVLRHFRPDFIRSFSTNPIIHPGMFKHNLLITYRGFLRNKSSFLINLIGLSTGLAGVFLIYLWVNDEVNVDKFHEKDRQLYQVMHNLHFPDNILTLDATPIPLAEALEEEIPEIKAALAISQGDQIPEGVLSFEGQQIAARGLFAEEDFFHLLSFPLAQGASKQVLKDKNSIILSEELALKIFSSTDNIIGETLEWSNQLFEGSFQVSGIFKNIPGNSTLQFDFVFPIQLLLDKNEESREWYSAHAETLLILKKGTNIGHLNQKIVDFTKGKHNFSSERSKLFVQQYSSKYLYNHYENGVQAGGRIGYVRLFSLIALIILLMACINFMNLSTAQASRKMKEIGVKKAIGAHRRALITQFLSESLLTAFFALAISLIWFSILLPQFNRITGKALSFQFEINNIVPILVIVLFTGLIAGSYPSFYLSGFKPIAALKGNLAASPAEQWVRKSLVVFQFALSVIFLVGVFFVNQQIKFIQTKNLGYEQDNILSFERKGDINSGDFEVFMSELKKLPGVVNTSSVYGDFIKDQFENVNFSWEGKQPDERLPFPSPTVSFDFVETLGMELLDGRSFSRAYRDDGTKIMVNEAAVKMMGIQDPVGKRIKFGDEDREIVGVVKDFNLKSLHQAVEPLFFRFGPNGNNMVVKIQAGTEKTTIEGLKAFYEKFHPGYAFKFTFMDNDYQSLYEAEQRVANLSKYFSGLAIIISCLGLLGLTIFTAERRRKEISIRKVLGANILQLIQLLSKDFTRMVLAAILIGLPISYLLVGNWLANFAYRIDLRWQFFVAAAVLTLLTAWLTVGFQVLKAAMVNPALNLKDE